MKEEMVRLAGQTVQVITVQTAVVGSGAAGLNAASRLFAFGQRDVVLVTEGMGRGTSRNTGSDKQTYYKLTLAGEEADSVQAMAETLFSGGCVDGEHALAEAAGSVRCFLRLVELGVPFPDGPYGEYVGYRTDHDPRRRATSAGPLTSKLMTEALEREVRELGVPILDGYQAVRILTVGGEAAGLLCLNCKSPQSAKSRWLLVNCRSLIWATGGPAGMYWDSVYPAGHWGSTGAALEAGAAGQNLTEWQFGLASVSPRWNVSGTYMQALPRFLSTAPDGSDPKEFLLDYFGDPASMCNHIFRKGYEWPFDAAKVCSGSSILDVLVFLETKGKGRRVVLDFLENPGGGELDAAALEPQAREYLTAAGACFGRPIDRLLKMNRPAVDFYRSRGVDLTKEPLEIALCAQHNNGGLKVNGWWETTLPGLFAVGEAAGTHGVTRPGGSALNAGQVGSLRAARYIAAKRTQPPISLTAFLSAVSSQAEALLAVPVAQTAESIQGKVAGAQRRMSEAGGPFRREAGLAAALKEAQAELAQWGRSPVLPQELSLSFRYRDLLLSQQAYLFAMLSYLRNGGKSRGSALYHDPLGTLPNGLSEEFRHSLAEKGGETIQEVRLTKDGPFALVRPRHPIPQREDFFENVWRSFRETGNVDAL